MPQQDEDAAELDEAEVVERLAFVAYDEAAKVAEPGEEPLDLPPSTEAAQRSAILRLGAGAAAAVRRDHLDAQLGQAVVERIGVVGPVADEALGQLRYEAGVELDRLCAGIEPGASQWYLVCLVGRVRAGGTNANATRIFLSFSIDGNQTWSAPQQISGQTSQTFMNDRFQPWIVADSSGLHAMWYERVASAMSGPDMLQSDKEDLSLVTTAAGPKTIQGEARLSSVTFPIVQTNPQQDPVIAFCYLGDKRWL